jgi:hypothetical protein
MVGPDACPEPDADPLQGGLELDHRSQILDGGDSGPAVVPGDPDESLSISELGYEGFYEMTPSGKLPDDVVQDFKEWVRRGAPAPAEDPAGSTEPSGDGAIDARER